MNKKFLYIFLFLLLSFGAFSQNMTRHFMTNLPTAGYTNASFFPDFRYTIGIPAFPYFSISFESNIRVKHLYELQNDTAYITIENFLNHLNKVSFIRFGTDWEILSTSFKVKNNFFSLSLMTHTATELRIPRDLFLLPLKGNAPYIGDRISFDGLGLDASVYNELAFGYTRAVTDRLNAGFRFSLLQGLACIKSNTNIGLTTDTTTYWLHMDYDASISISGPMDTNLFSSNSNADPLGDFMANPSKNFGLTNVGFGLSLGADYDLTDNFNIGLSLNNLGYIKWKNDVKTYSINDGLFSFEGIKIDTNLSVVFNNMDSFFSNMLDSSLSQFDMNKTVEPFKTSLSPEIYLTLTYKLNEKNRFGFVMHDYMHDYYNLATFSLLYQRKLLKFINLSGNYSFNTFGQSKVGAGLTLRIMGSNFYLMTNDIPGLAKPFNLSTINLQFGYYYIKTKPPKDKHKVKKKKSDFQF
ncbi:DUF5723 family protein [Bacteroidota bacterium]